jgi:hypothetical protein
VVQFGDDWPGTFLRGDHAGPLAHTIGALLDDVEAGRPIHPLTIMMLRGMIESLAACDTRSGKPVTQLRPFAECVVSPSESRADRIRLRKLWPGEQAVHDAIMDGLLGMGWWEHWIEHPPSEAIAADLRRIQAKVCGCGRAPCTPYHGVELVDGFWRPIPYGRRLRFLLEEIDHARATAPNPRLRPLWCPKP